MFWDTFLTKAARNPLPATRRPRSLSVEKLERRDLLAADVFISEFMAANNSTILDSDGDASDWVELYNQGDAAQSLDGWYLTDSDSDLNKWQFPAVEIAAGQSLLVWASNKDRTDPAEPLHTNFKLSKGGEYLALVEPDGSTIAAQFAPEFPQQYQDVSFGYDATSTIVPLISHTTETQVFVPADDSLGDSWTSETFAPSPEWQIGTEQAIGYDTASTYLPLIGTTVAGMRNENNSAYIRLPFESTAASFSELELRIRYDDGFVAYLNGQEVARDNAPTNVTWNSKAPADRYDSIAVGWETFDLSEYAHLIHEGENVLAIHGLNVVVSSSDFLIDTELTGTAVEIPDAEPRYFLTPTPGESNVAGTQDTRPFIFDVEGTPASDVDDIVVTAAVVAAGSPVAGVDLHYRVMYGAETVVSMFDDGLHGDGAAGDNVYGAAIPAAESDPGEMVRYFVTASADSNAVGRFPYFTDPDSTTEYLGDVIPDASVTSNMPIFQMFVEDPFWYRNSSGSINKNETTASFFYDGHFYDNIRLRARGQSSVANRYPIQKLKVDFNDDNRFDFGDGREDVGSFNLDNVYQDPSYARLTLGAEVFRELGAYAQLAEPVHTEMNGEFYSLGIFSERLKKPFLRRNGLPDEGALYESEGIYNGPGQLSSSAGNLGNTNGFEKDNREEEAGMADLQALVNGISPSNPNREQYIYDNIDIPSVLNVMAGYSITKHFDRDTHNYFMYRDSDGTGEWSLIPYDLDLIWDRLAEPIYSTYFTGHPFEGSSQDPTWGGTHWNRLIDAFSDIPSLREMVVRRLRTGMDEILQPLDTPLEDRYLETRADEIFNLVQPEAALNLAKWGEKSGGSWRGPWPVGGGTDQLKDAFDSRRNYLYGLSIIPDAQADDVVVQIGNIDVYPESGDQDQEYIEIINPNNTAVDLSGWQLGEAVEYEFVKGVVIPANSSMYVTPDVVAFRARTSSPTGGESKLVQGGYSGHLSRTGETIRLLRPDGSEADSLTYAATVPSQELVLAEWQAHYGEQNFTDDDVNTPDLDMNQTVDGLDFLSWQRTYGAPENSALDNSLAAALAPSVETTIADAALSNRPVDYQSVAQAVWLLSQPQASAPLAAVQPDAADAVLRDREQLTPWFTTTGVARRQDAKVDLDKTLKQSDGEESYKRVNDEVFAAFDRDFDSLL